MRSKWVQWGAGLVWSAAVAVGAGAQNVVPVSAVSAELQVLAGGATTIFVGQIVSVARKGSIVEVQFRVEQAVRGEAGGTFAMREWAGMWPAGHMRYVVGERVLAFVNGASAAGLSSPVHGAEGLVPVVVQGAAAAELLDVRRVAASVVRAPGVALPTEANGAVQLSEALGWIKPPAGGVGTGRGLLPVSTRGRRPVLGQGTAVAAPADGSDDSPLLPSAGLQAGRVLGGGRDDQR